jgi:hypothetical protein
MTAWREVESEVYFPNRWVSFAAGWLLVLLGMVGAGPVWSFLFSTGGGALVVWSIRRIYWPIRIRHASPEVLPAVPNEPVLFDGLCVHYRLKLKLVEDADGWQLQPTSDLSGNDRIFLFGIGIVVLTACAGTISYILHHQQIVAWPLSILAGVIATLLFGAPIMVLWGMMSRLSYHRLSRMSVARNRDEVVVELSEMPDTTRTDLASALNWAFPKEDKRGHFFVPRSLLRAVQLCPCKYATGTRESTLAVEGLLVFEGSTPGQYVRLPLVLTTDFDGAARLMQQIAATLDIPYLFGAHQQGWKMESRRAAERPPLKVGGSMT